MWQRDHRSSAASARHSAPRSFVDTLAFRAAQQPDQLAYRFLLTGDPDGAVEELTFGELGARARAIGGWLQERDFAGARALLLYPPGLEFVRGYMGCLFGGVVAVPCPAPLSGRVHRALPRLRRLVADAGAEVVLTTAPLLDALRDACADVPDLAALTWVATEQIPYDAREVWHDPGAGPDSIAFLQYTSGSTSAPRGVMVSHGNLLDNQRIIAEALENTPEGLAGHDGDLLVSWLPVFHDMGLIAGVLQATYVGRTATLMSPLHFLQDPRRWLEAVSAYRPHMSGGPNFAYELCLRRATPQLLERLDLSAWRVAFNGAEPVRADTLRRFADMFAPAGFRREAFYPCYGLAEATLMVSGGEVASAPAIGPAPVQNPGAPVRERDVVSCGRPRMPTVIVDPELGVQCADGEVGEIWVSGASVAAGYWNDPATSEETFNARLADGRDGFLRTGDLGFVRDGELYISGRRKDLLIIDGRNHYPQDLELTAETAHPAVRPGCAAAFAVAGEDGERPVLVAEVAAEARDEQGAVASAIRRAVSEEHGLALRDVVLIQPGGIHKTSSGKIQRAATRKAYLEGSLTLLAAPPDTEPRAREIPAGPEAEAPSAGFTGTPSASVIEAWLVDAVARRAEIDPARIAVGRSIADYGIGSRGLVEIVGELSDKLGHKLEPAVLYEHPTIAGAARAFAADAARGSASAAASAPRERHRARSRAAAPASEPIAIVSMACRYPGDANDPEALWRILAEGADVVGDPPGRRWDAAALHDPDPDAPGKAYTLRGGYLRDIDRFDAAFFGISPREAAAMDPQQRLLLETAWEALERAGIVPGRLGESATGVYVGLYDSGYLSAARLEQLDGHVGTGSAPSVASGRIAYALGLQGPAVTVDTACSSSLVAIHLAAQALRGGECDLALAGGATVMTTPRAFVEFSRLRGLSASGRSRPFAAGADGIVWAEGCGLLLLKRLSDARRDGDRVLAVIRGSAVNQDGRSQGLSAPNGLAQERVVRAALSAAEVRPQDIDYVEAHGTGTALGDPIEARALARVFGGSRPADSPLYLGSLKSNLGHAQAAAGVGGVIKTVLALQHEELPASLHAETPTTQLDWHGAGLRVLSRPRPWPRGERVRRAGVSSFGISGTNAHLILEEAPERGTGNAAVRGDGDVPALAAAGSSGSVWIGGASSHAQPGVLPALEGAPMLFPVSARSLSALRGQAARLVQAVEANPHLPLRPVAATLAHHRTHFERRAVVAASDRAQLLDGLRALAAADTATARPPAVGPGKLAFVFPGQGSQWSGMCADLLGRCPVFAAQFERCDAALRPHTGWSALAVLRGEPGAPDLRRVDVVQPMLFAVMVSLAALWRAYGVEPDAVVGHSQGEVAAAYIAGALSLQDAAKVVALRSKAVRAVAGDGAMAMVEQSTEQLAPRLAALDGRVSVAAINSSRSAVLSGDASAIDALIAQLERENVFARRLRVDYASHSAEVESLRDTILADLAGVVPSVPSVPWYSTVPGETLADRGPDAEYWFRNLREPVHYAAAVERMIGDGFRYFVELSPHPSLIVATQTIAEDARRAVGVVGSLRREEDGPECMVRSLGELHVAGRDVHWDLLVPDGWQADLPTYAFDGERYWIDPAPSRVPAGDPDPAADVRHPLLGAEIASADASRCLFRKAWTVRSTDWLPDHAVFGRVVLSGTTVLELCRAALGAAFPDRPADVADLLLIAPLVLPEAETVDVQIEVVRAESESEIAEISVFGRLRGAGRSDWTLHATAVGVEPGPLPAEPAARVPREAAPVWDESSYARLAEAGLAYGSAFRCVRSAFAIDESTILARLSLPQPAADHSVTERLHPALLDAALHVASTFDTSGRTLLPVAVGRSSLPAIHASELIAMITRRSTADAVDPDADLTVDVTLWDLDDFPAGQLSGVRLRAATSADIEHRSHAGRDLYEVTWTPIGRPAAEPNGVWALITQTADPLVDATARALEAGGVRAVTVGADEALPQGTGTVVRFWPSAAGADDGVAHRTQRATATGLAELQARLAERPEDAPSRLVWVTRGALAAAGGDAVSALDQSALWGLARSARTEHPDLGPALVDLDPGADPPASAALAAALIAAVCQSGEPELAVRGGALLAPRLIRAAAAEQHDQTPRVADGTVLVTGGLGAIGVQIACRLATRGARRFVLTSRFGASSPRSAAVVAQLAALGAEAEVVACDIADPEAVSDLLYRIAEREQAPLRGVVHAAGALADAVITEQTPETLTRALRPKIAGAWNLHRLTLGLPLDFFVLLSSAAAVAGAAGQGNYAAANAFLDQLAHHRRALGLPATSVSYGAWSGGGLAVEHADLDRMSALGFRALEVDHALDLFELCLQRPTPHLVAWALDLDRVRMALAHGGESPALWRTLLPPPARTAAGSTLTDRLGRLSDAERFERVLAIVGTEVAQALGLRSAADVLPDQPLRDVGLDSVSALDVRNRIGARIGARLPATLLFDYPTTGRLAEHLLDTVLRRSACAVHDAEAARQSAATALVRASERQPAEPPAGEPIAIVSMACRFPGAVADPEQLWRLLADGRDAIGPFPAGRWDAEAVYDPDPDAAGKSYAREGGFIEDVDAFDARFFGITAREAAAMDPQQRLLLETAWEALERAGIVPSRLAGSMTGVYIGMFGSEYASGAGLEQLDGYHGTGTSLSVASGRLAYALGLVGPAVTVDTACSSSLLALHLAAAALRAGECDTALAGGATVMATPQTFVEFSRLRALSPTGRSRSFSDDADGTGLSEGVGIVLLKRLADARRDGDQVLAVLRGTAVNQDGRSQGLSVPNGPSQEQVIRLALQRSGLSPADIDYVEAHGTGTTLGDPIEANALARVFKPHRPADRPLLLGSLKSNIGHPQAAAGIAGLMKVVLSLRHRQLPATLHAATPNRHVDWDDSGLRLVREPTPWLPGERPRRAGVSAFGISGTNVHVIVEEAPQPPQPPEQAADVEPAAPRTGGAPAKRLFVVSARSDAALRRQAARLAGHVAERPDTHLPDIAYTLARRRSHFERRTAVVASDLDTLLAGLADTGVPQDAQPALTGKIAFVFPGHSPRWTGMALDLLDGNAAFAEAFDRCDEAVARHAGWSVRAVLRGEDGAPDAERADVTQPLLFAVDCALASLWRSLGVEPDAVVGHSLGEIAAAHIAGMLTLDQAAALVVARGLAVREVAGLGGSLAVALSPRQAVERIAAFGDRLALAAINGDQATTISGDADALAELRAQLEEEGIPVRQVPVDFATHSAHMDRLRDGFLTQIAQIDAERGALPLYSTVTAEPAPGDTLDAGYWYRNLREPVQFAAAVRRMLADGYRYFVEIGPHPALVSSIRAVAAQAAVPVAAVGSLRRAEDGYDNVLRNLALLYVAGYDPDWSKQFPDGTLLDLPTYAFEPDRHWMTPAHGASPGAPHAKPFVHQHIEASDEPGRHLVQAEIDLRDSRCAYLADHRIAGAVWLPAAAFVEMALEAAALLHPSQAARLSRLSFERALELRADEPVRLQMVIQPLAGDGTRAFTIASRPSSAGASATWTGHVSGLITPETAEVVDPPEPLAALRVRCADQADISDFYTALAAAGVEYRDAFRGVEAGWRGPREALGRLADAPRSAHLLHPALLDAALQTVALPADAPAGQAFVPVAADRIRFTGLRTRPTWATSRVRSLSADKAVLDVQLLDDRERVVLDVEGFELSALAAADGSLYEVRWKPAPLSAPAAAEPGPAVPGRWLVLADASGVGAEITARLDAAAAAHVVVRCGGAGDDFAVDGPAAYRIDPQNADHFTRLLREAFEDRPPDRVVQLFGLDTPALTGSGADAEAVNVAEAADRAALLCCTSTLRLVTALADRSWTPAPRLFLVTRGSQAAGGSAHVTRPQQALLWGFGATVARERPELRATLIDLPAAGGADQLWTELLHADGEQQIALRDAGRLVPRLAPARPDSGPGLRIRADRTYLVTGGLGGLGRVVAERLAALGARHLAVLGRSEPNADAAQWIGTLAQRGVTVHVVRADVGDRAQLMPALRGLRDAAPAIAGIVHTAGVLDDATLTNLTPQRISRVLAPKVLGAVLLTDLVPETDFLVLFSSAAGLLGSAGQSSYAAANAFLDAWAHHLESAGRAALSLDWGAWSHVGMVTGSAARAAAIGRSGLGSFSPREGAELFGRVLGSTRRQLAPIVLDHAALREHPAPAGGRALLADLIAPVPPQRPASDLGPRELVARMRTAAADERLELLETYLRGLLSRVTGDEMGHVCATTPLKELDLDSLLLVTLYGTIARELGVELSASAATSAADIRSLAETIVAALPDAPAERSEEQIADTPRAVPGGSVVPAEAESRPATRDVTRLLRSEQQGTPSTAHNIGFAARLLVPTTRERMTRMLGELANRHAALRTGIVADAGHGPQLRVLRHPAGELLRWSAVSDDVDVDQRLRELMEPPFDLAAPPLWRFEMLEYPSGRQVLLYGAHHAVSDAQSLILVMAEIGAELHGARLDGAVTNRDIDRLLEAQPPQQAQQQAGAEPVDPPVRQEFAGVQRLDLALSRPRPATRTFRCATRFLDMPEDLLERVTAQASRLAITPAALCLGTLTVLLARLRGRDRFALAVPVDTRMHVGALDAVGFFGVPVPFAARVDADEPIADVLRRTDARLARVLDRGASFFDAMPALVQEGLYRPDAPLVEVYFNFIRPQALTVRGLEILQAGTGYSDLDLMVSIAGDLNHLRLDYNLDIIDEPDCLRLGRDYLALLAEVAHDADAPAIPATVASASVAVAATFALGDLTAMLETALVDQGCALAPAPYFHALAALQDPTGVFAQPQTSAGVVLLRAADLVRFGPVTDELLAESADGYATALHALQERSALPLIVGFPPSAPPDERLLRWEYDLAARLREQPGLAVLTAAEWTAGFGDVAGVFDAETDALAHLPFTAQFQASLALTVADLVRSIRRPAPKVIAVDGDETLWGGVAAEVGPDAVDLGGPRARLARRLLEWRAAGVLLALVSNNDEATVHGVLQRPDSILRPGHFSAISVTWGPKARRLEAIAEGLGLGLDGFLYLDDNPVEIGAMRSTLPEVLSVTCPPANELDAFLTRLWPVIPKAATREDAARADFYRQERLRDRERERSGFAEFLDRLGLVVEVEPLTEATIERSAQLSRRTNQFNLRPMPLDEAALARWRRDGEVWTASVRDRFGDYGQVGVLVLRRGGDVLEVVAWMLSCRALGRGVEERLLGWLADRAEALGCTAVRLVAEHTPRNIPARRLVAALAGGEADSPRLDVAVPLARLREYRSWDEGSGEHGV